MYEGISLGEGLQHESLLSNVGSEPHGQFLLPESLAKGGFQGNEALQMDEDRVARRLDLRLWHKSTNSRSQLGLCI